LSGAVFRSYPPNTMSIAQPVESVSAASPCNCCRRTAWNRVPGCSRGGDVRLLERWSINHSNLDRAGFGLPAWPGRVVYWWLQYRLWFPSADCSDSFGITVTIHIPEPCAVLASDSPGIMGNESARGSNIWCPKSFVAMSGGGVIPGLPPLRGEPAEPPLSAGNVQLHHGILYNVLDVLFIKQSPPKQSPVAAIRESPAVCRPAWRRSRRPTVPERIQIGTAPATHCRYRPLANQPTWNIPLVHGATTPMVPHSPVRNRLALGGSAQHLRLPIWLSI